MQKALRQREIVYVNSIYFKRYGSLEPRNDQIELSGKRKTIMIKKVLEVFLPLRMLMTLTPSEIETRMCEKTERKIPEIN